MGATYTRLSTGELLRILRGADRRRLMETYYTPHHARLENAVTTALACFGRCLIVDVHSFSSLPLPHESDQTVPRPEICVGFDEFHSPFGGAADARNVCERMGFSADVNRPLSGSIVPRKYWNADARVRSFMIDVRRDLYMDEATGLKRPSFSVMAGRVCGLIEELRCATPEEGN
jgi:N-formylglutamate amidohydrolase